MPDTADVAIVGGGPAGAALAIRLADRGISSIVIERAAQPKWRACGVFSSPLTRGRLVELGLSTQAVASLSRPISALNLETTRGARCRIDYEHGYACGFDRVQLDSVLLDRARAVGAEVRAATLWRSMSLAGNPREYAWLTISPTTAHRRGDTREIRARLVVGADGSWSSVASHVRVASRPRFYLWKSGITFHRADADALPDGQPMEGRFLFGTGWYVGIAPVPAKRVNIGIVVPGTLLRERPEQLVNRLLEQFPSPRPRWVNAPTTDQIRVAGGLSSAVKRTAGDGFLLVGDACGFIDPLTGEGLHRALVGAELAAEAVRGWLDGDRSAMEVYDRRLRSRFRSKDVISWVLQALLARPTLLDYAVRRLASRRRHREELTLVLTDQMPASRALDPRFLARLLAP